MTAQPVDERWLAFDVRKQAVLSSLQEEARLHEHFVSQCRRFLSKQHFPALLKTNSQASSIKETQEYWRRHDTTAIVQLFAPIIETGAQPIFASISLSIASTNPTLFVPVPYFTARDSFSKFRASLWLNGTPSEIRGIKPTPDALEAAAREISHALANISYSARMDDKPVLGWLASFCHETHVFT